MSAEFVRLLDYGQYGVLTLTASYLPALLYERVFPKYNGSRNVFLQLFEALIEFAVHNVTAFEILQLLVPLEFIEFPVFFYLLLTPLMLPNALAKINNAVRQVGQVAGPLNWKWPDAKTPVNPPVKPDISPIDWNRVDWDKTKEHWKRSMQQWIATLEARLTTATSEQVQQQLQEFKAQFESATDMLKLKAQELRALQKQALINQWGQWCSGIQLRINNLQTRIQSEIQAHMAEENQRRRSQCAAFASQGMAVAYDEELQSCMPTVLVPNNAWMQPAFYNTKQDGSQYASTLNSQGALDPVDYFWDEVDSCEKLQKLYRDNGGLSRSGVSIFQATKYYDQNGEEQVALEKINARIGYAIDRSLGTPSTVPLPLINIAGSLNKGGRVCEDAQLLSISDNCSQVEKVRTYDQQGLKVSYQRDQYGRCQQQLKKIVEKDPDEEEEIFIENPNEKCEKVEGQKLYYYGITSAKECEDLPRTDVFKRAYGDVKDWSHKYDSKNQSCVIGVQKCRD